MECVYLIQDKGSGLHKIGMTTNWERRKKELKVGSVTTQISVVSCKNAAKWERALHAMFAHKRMPQSEWFRITSSEAIPKMEWLAKQTTSSRSNFIIGNWRQAQDGHYYRRRKSSKGNWYTEQKSALAVREQIEAQLELSIQTVVRTKTEEARKEPGYWPKQDDQTQIEWADRDPTYTPSSGKGCLVALALGVALLALVSANTKQPNADVGYSPTPDNYSEPTLSPQVAKPAVEPKKEVAEPKATCSDTNGTWLVVGPGTEDLRTIVTRDFCSDAFINSSGKLQVARIADVNDASKLTSFLSSKTKTEFTLEAAKNEPSKSRKLELDLPAEPSVKDPVSGSDKPQALDNQLKGLPPSKPSPPETRSCVLEEASDAKAVSMDCILASKENPNGITTYDVTWADGDRSTYIFLSSGSVEIHPISPSGDRINASFKTKDNATVIETPQSMKIIIPSFVPRENFISPGNSILQKTRDLAR